MTAFDAHSNFGYGTVATAPSPGTSGTVIVLGTATFADFPDPSSTGAYNATVWPTGTIPLSTNAEIFRVVAKGSNGTLNITRAQESTTNRNITSSDQVAVSWTKKKVEDVQDQFSTGWVQYDFVTPTRASADDPTYVLTFAGVDLTSKISVGMKVKLTQSTDKYFIVTAISFSTNTTLTLYGGTDYDVADTAVTAISAFYYSPWKAPFGFPMDPTKWTAETTSSSLGTQASPTADTWYNTGSVSLSIPVGSWNVYYSGNTTIVGGSNPQVRMTLSTANNSQSDSKWTCASHTIGNSAQDGFSCFRMGVITISTKASYYLNLMTPTTSVSNMYLRSDLGDTIIRAVCAYL